jgi:hypothetical protein
VVENELAAARYTEYSGRWYVAVVGACEQLRGRERRGLARELGYDASVYAP